MVLAAGSVPALAEDAASSAAANDAAAELPGDRHIVVSATRTPVAIDEASAWLPHCYAMVGVARNLSPDTGTGAELYAVIGQAPRQLDRNIAVVGRVIEGMDLLASLPRGSGDLGFYAAGEKRLPILSVRLASDLPESQRPRYQVMDVGSRSFADYLRLRANRKDDFYERPAGGVDLCNAPVPVREAP